jgi:hypothetical protein
VFWLGIQCLGWTLIAVILYPLLPQRWGRPLGRRVIMVAFSRLSWQSQPVAPLPV